MRKKRSKKVRIHVLLSEAAVAECRKRAAEREVPLSALLRELLRKGMFVEEKID